MIIGLGEHTTRRFLLQVPLLAGPSRVLMSTTDRGVDAQALFTSLASREQSQMPLPTAKAIEIVAFVSDSYHLAIDGQVAAYPCCVFGLRGPGA